MVKKTLYVAVLFAVATAVQARDVNVRDFGAAGDGKTFDTESIQKAIDECSSTGGGVVRVPAGEYLCGTLMLKSNIDLYLDHCATIKGSTAVTDKTVYPKRGLIMAVGQENVRILGPGKIDGQSNTPEFLGQGLKNSDGKRPYLAIFDKCRNVTVRDVSLVNAAFWTLRFYRCDGVLADGITISSPYFFNNDGIDIDSKNVRISNCNIAALDDAICMKSDDPAFMPENIVITNCVVASTCNPIKFGTASKAGLRNVTISNCVVRKPEWDGPWDWTDSTKFYRGIPSGTKTGLDGIAIECADGGTVEHIAISNITMEGIITPIFLCLNKRKGVGSMRDIRISNVTATANGILPCMITGIAESKIKDVVLRDITVEHEGGEKAMKEPLPEAEKSYPENRMYGLYNPACGLFVRHAENIVVENFQITTRRPDGRPAVVLDDVREFRGNGIRYNGKDITKKIR